MGVKPPKPSVVTGTVSRTQIAVTAGDGTTSISFTATVQLPTTGTAPYPVMIGIGGISLNTNAIRNMGVAISECMVLILISLLFRLNLSYVILSIYRAPLHCCARVCMDFFRAPLHAVNFNNNDIAQQNSASSRGIGKFYTLYGAGEIDRERGPACVDVAYMCCTTGAPDSQTTPPAP